MDKRRVIWPVFGKEIYFQRALASARQWRFFHPEDRIFVDYFTDHPISLNSYQDLLDDCQIKVHFEPLTIHRIPHLSPIHWVKYISARCYAPALIVDPDIYLQGPFMFDTTRSCFFMDACRYDQHPYRHLIKAVIQIVGCRDVLQESSIIPQACLMYYADAGLPKLMLNKMNLFSQNLASRELILSKEFFYNFDEVLLGMLAPTLGISPAGHSSQKFHFHEACITLDGYIQTVSDSPLPLVHKGGCYVDDYWVLDSKTIGFGQIITRIIPAWSADPAPQIFFQRVAINSFDESKLAVRVDNSDSLSEEKNVIPI